MKWWDPSKRLVHAIRKYQSAKSKIARSFWGLQHQFWSLITHSEIHLTQKIGGGLMIPHPNGIILHPEAIVGVNCLIFQQVTIGLHPNRQGAPVIGGHVDIGAGAKVLGPVTIGDHASIGANAVVLQDVPSGALAVGVPARVVFPEARVAAE